MSAPPDPSSPQANNPSRPSRRLARPLILLTIALMLGLFSALTIAWTSALYLPVATLGWRSHGVVALDGDHLQPWLISLHRPTADRTIWFEKGRIWSKRGVGPPSGEGSSAAVSGWSFATSTRTDPKYTKGPVEVPATLRDTLQKEPMVAWGGAEDRRGWPLPALQGRVFGSTDPKSDAVWFGDRAVIAAPGLQMLGGGGESLATVRILPLEPIWSGLILDTAVLALGWFLAITVGRAALVSLFARFRTPLGHCPTCGYDLRASPGRACPECGSVVNGATPAAPARPASPAHR